MDTKLLKEIISIVEQADITSFEVCQGDLKIRIGKGNNHVYSNSSFGNESFRNDFDNRSMNSPNNDKVVNSNLSNTDNKNMDNNTTTDNDSDSEYEKVISPMLGVFYSSPSPESKAFVKIGDKVKKGDVLCIIEAMKLMNEIVCEKDGEIAKILLENGQIVEFGQTIFLMK